MLKKSLLLLVTITFLFQLTNAQALKGNWEWRSPMDKEKRQTIFGTEQRVPKVLSERD
jgi:hypothetical protein